MSHRGRREQFQSSARFTFARVQHLAEPRVPPNVRSTGSLPLRARRPCLLQRERPLAAIAAGLPLRSSQAFRLSGRRTCSAPLATQSECLLAKDPRLRCKRPARDQRHALAPSGSAQLQTAALVVGLWTCPGLRDTGLFVDCSYSSV